MTRAPGRRRATSVTSARNFAASMPALRITGTMISSRNSSSSVGSAAIFQPHIAISLLQRSRKDRVQPWPICGNRWLFQRRGIAPRVRSSTKAKRPLS
jgi:hypothetical protein